MDGGAVLGTDGDLTFSSVLTDRTEVQLEATNSIGNSQFGTAVILANSGSIDPDGNQQSDIFDLFFAAQSWTMVDPSLETGTNDTIGVDDLLFVFIGNE